MQLTHDEELEKEAGPYYGKYLGTFFSAQGQVRADLFDNGVHVIAYISFPTGRDLKNVKDRYVAILRDFAASQGFGERFHLIFAA